MRGLVALSVRRPVSVFMASLALIAFGWVGLQRLAIELLPDISYPSLTVQTEFPDTAPQEVENLVTRPVEEAVVGAAARPRKAKCQFWPIKASRSPAIPKPTA